MPIGMYRSRSHKHLLPPAHARSRRSDYIESKAALERNLAEAIERGKLRLAQQREELRRTGPRIDAL